MKKIYGLFVFMINIVSAASAVVVEVPPAWGNRDIAVTGSTRIQADEFTVFSFIQLINDYLRFFMGAIAFGVLIYGGIKLITAQGDAEKMSSANRLLLGAGIGIVIVIFSYAVVRLIVNVL